MLDIRDVACSYDGAHDVVHRVSLCVEPGERVVLLGLNGSGKSTLGRLANGSLAPSAGVVEVDGSREGLAHLVGYVRQDPRNQLVSPVVSDEVAFGPRNLGLSPDEVRGRVAASLEACGITGLADRLTSELSGGQQQLVAIAGVVAMEPRYLVLDEVGSQLDEASRERVRSLVGRLVASGIGVLEIAHSAESLFGASQVMVLSGGRAAWRGTPEGFLSDDDAMRLSGMEKDPTARLLSRAVRAGYELGQEPDPEGIAKRVASLDPSRTRGEAASERHVLRGGNVTVTYDQTSALCGACVAASGITLVLGASGSGKTTLARVLSGVLAPDSGTATLDGDPVLPGDVGLSFQRPEDQLFCDTVLDDIAYGPRARGCSDPEAIARSAAERLGVSRRLLERSPFELSGGQMRRVALAGTLALDPRAYVFDEPTAGLDAPARLEFRRLARELAKEGSAVLVVTHDAGEWLEEADEVILMDSGRTVFSGSPEEVLSDPEVLVRAGLSVPLLLSVRARIGRGSHA